VSQAATVLTKSIGYGSDGALQKALEDKNISVVVGDLIDDVRPQFSHEDKSSGLGEIDMLYMSMIERQAEIETLMAEMKIYKVPF
jgi:hypothetical protein